MLLATCLTPSKLKAEYFSRDLNYLTALGDALQIWGATPLVIDTLWNTASLLLRPDAIAGQQASALLPVLRGLGFMPIAAATTSITAEQTRDLWRYQANVSTRDRLRLLDLIMTSGRSLYILLRDLTHRNSAPATVHLNYLKGTAIVENRKRNFLRTIAGPKIASVVSYIHVSDDPADMLREMAILLTRDQRLNLMRQVVKAVDRTDLVRTLLSTLEASCPKDLLSLAELDLPSVNANMPSNSKIILNTAGLKLSEMQLRQRWGLIVTSGKTCSMFVDGDTYDSKNATIPDGTEHSLPLDGHLIFREFGPR